jgi:mRNA interferase MazF
MPEFENEKDFTEWHSFESRIQSRKSTIYFNEGEIWFCSIGLNIGFEQDGKGEGFWRPVLIVKKYNQEFFTGIPLTTKDKRGKHYFDLDMSTGFKGKLILSQIRSFSSKRLANMIGLLNQDAFLATKKAASEYIFGS